MAGTKRKASSQMRRPRKKTRRTGRKSALRSLARTQIYAFKRFINAKVAITGSDAVSSLGGGTTFLLTDTPGYTEFTTLFDQYKIAGVAYRWVIDTDPMQQTTKKFPALRWVHDYDDAATPGSLSVIQQYPAMREFWFTESRQATPWNYIKPARAAVEFEGATNSAYRPQWKGFIDCASDGTPHYALKYWVDYLQGGVRLLLQCRYYLVFKNVR